MVEVSDHTGFPEIMDGRVKTLQPSIHGGILARRTDTGHQKAMSDHKIAGIDLVVVNLYPFEATVARGADFPDLRREHRHRRPGADPRLGQEPRLRHGRRRSQRTTPRSLDELAANKGATTLALRRKLAAKAYARTASYDSAIANWFAAQEGETFPERLTLSAERVQTLRYGENPHQKAAFYSDGSKRPGVATARMIQGKELSYNNIGDTEAAYECVAEFAESGHRRREARQPLRRGRRCRPVQGLSQGLCLRSGVDLRRHRRGQPHARSQGRGRGLVEALPRGRDRARRHAGGAGDPRHQEERARAAGRHPARSDHRPA